MDSLTAAYRKKSSFTPGGYWPWKYPITATTLGSLIVQAHPIRSPR